MIYVDNRGDGEKAVAEILESKHYPVELRHIESGDYVIGELGIERKTVSDLVGSVTSKEKGHNFWKQIETMKATYKKVIVIIEGPIDWRDRMLSGIIYGLIDGWQIPFLNTLGHAQTAEQIGRLHDRYGSARANRVPPAAVQKGYTVKQIKWMMLQTIPHLGGVVAGRVVEAYPEIFTMRQDDDPYSDVGLTWSVKLSKVEGLRKDSKEMLLKVLKGNAV